MDEHAAVPRVADSRRPGFVAPLELGHKFVICEVRLSSCQVAIMLPTNSQEAVGEGKDLVRIFFGPEIFQERIKRAEIIILQQMNDSIALRSRSATHAEY